MQDLSPIVLFTFKRYQTLKLTVSALKNNYLSEQSDLIIYSDGAKTFDDIDLVNQIRVYLKTITGFKSIKIIESPINKGLANSIIDGVSEVLSIYGTAIILEDDLVTSRNFLNFMNESLALYESDEQVNSISAYTLNLDFKKDTSYFLNRPWPWGWATWENRWNKVDWEIKDYQHFKNNSTKRKEFAKLGSDVNSMLSKQMEGFLDSWYICFTYNQFKNNCLTIYPAVSKIDNIGFDEFATHTIGSKSRFISKLDISNQVLFNFPNEIKIHCRNQKLFLKKMGLRSRILNKVFEFFSLEFHF